MSENKKSTSLLEVGLIAAMITVAIIVGLTYIGNYMGPQHDGLTTSDIITP